MRSLCQFRAVFRMDHDDSQRAAAQGHYHRNRNRVVPVPADGDEEQRRTPMKDREGDCDRCRTRSYGAGPGPAVSGRLFSMARPPLRPKRAAKSAAQGCAPAGAIEDSMCSRGVWLFRGQMKVSKSAASGPASLRPRAGRSLSGTA